jgi:hypothetical protein
LPVKVILSSAEVSSPLSPSCDLLPLPTNFDVILPTAWRIQQRIEFNHARPSFDIPVTSQWLHSYSYSASERWGIDKNWNLTGDSTMEREVRQKRSEAWRRPPTSHVVQLEGPLMRLGSPPAPTKGCSMVTMTSTKSVLFLLLKRLIQQLTYLQDEFESGQEQRSTQCTFSFRWTTGYFLCIDNNHFFLVFLHLEVTLYSKPFISLAVSIVFNFSVIPKQLHKV